MLRALQFAGFAALFAGAVFAQTGTADIHASPPNTIPEMRSRFVRGRFELRNATLVDLIRTAWSVDADKVVGGPDWLGADRFDVTVAAPADSTPETLKTMLRTLLADRFQLVVHRDTRSLRAYAMTVAGKPLLKPADGSGESGCAIGQSTNPGPVAFECRNMTMAAFAKQLSGVREASGYLFNYPVADRTGLQGAWNFRVEWSPRVAQRPDPPARDAKGLPPGRPWSRKVRPSPWSSKWRISSRMTPAIPPFAADTWISSLGAACA